MPIPHAWFAFPFGDGAEERVRSIAREHEGYSVIGLSTPIPNEKGLSLIQVLTFVDPELGYRHLFSEKLCREFLALALSVHAGFHVREHLLIAAMTASTHPVSRAFGASHDELFLLAPTHMSSLIQSAMEDLLATPGAVINPWKETGPGD